MNHLNINIITFSVLSGFILGVLFFIFLGILKIMYCRYVKKKVEDFLKRNIFERREK